MFWFILLAVLIIAIIISVIALQSDRCWDWPYFVIGISVALEVIISVLLIIIAYDNYQSVNQFITQKKYIESRTSINSVEDAALTNKKIELNEWLINAQWQYKNLRFFTILPAGIMELEQIK